MPSHTTGWLGKVQACSTWGCWALKGTRRCSKQWLSKSQLWSTPSESPGGLIKHIDSIAIWFTESEHLHVGPRGLCYYGVPQVIATLNKFSFGLIQLSCSQDMRSEAQRGTATSPGSQSWLMAKIKAELCSLYHPSLLFPFQLVGSSRSPWISEPRIAQVIFSESYWTCPGHSLCMLVGRSGRK